MRRLVRWLFAPFIILALLFVVANVVVQRVAQSKIAATLESTFHLAAKPTVSIGGFPIIGSILSGHLPRVSFSAASATFQGLTVEHISVTLVDVGASGGFLRGGPLTIEVGAGTVRARATNAAVNAYFKDHGQNATIAFHEGHAVVRAVRTFLGRKRTLVADGTVAREGSALVFRPTSVTVDGQPPPPGTEQLAKQKATLRVQLPPLPGGITSYGIKAVEGAAAISANLQNQRLDLSG
jgi:DUF2993 family protein